MIKDTLVEAVAVKIANEWIPRHYLLLSHPLRINESQLTIYREIYGCSSREVPRFEISRTSYMYPDHLPSNKDYERIISPAGGLLKSNFRKLLPTTATII